MREIGGYIDCERYNTGEYYPNLLHLNIVRNAILLIIKEKNYHKIWIPKYLCSSIENSLKKHDIQVEYYTLAKDLSPVLDRSFQKNEALLFVNYFGQFDNEALERFQQKYPNIIIDNTQSFFQRPSPKLDTVYTCRKYFGVPDGAYLHLTIPSTLYNDLPTDQSYLRMLHILGRFERTASEFYDEFRKIDTYFEQEDIKKMSILTQNLLNSIDYKRVAQKRSDNFNKLHDMLHKANILEIKHEGGLYMYPFFIRGGHKIKDALIKEKIYVPTLWPNVLQECSASSFEYGLANDLVLLPIDQRYGFDDMNYILKTLLKTLKERGYHDY